MSPADLSLLSTLLDEALDLPPTEREDWFARLEGEAAAMTPTLRDLLARHASKAADPLLDRHPTFTAPGDTAAAATFQVGDAVGPYRLLRPIGQGGMGEVWLAERSDGQLRRQVALKLPVLGLRNSVLVQRFARERDIVGALAHPHIARLYDAGLATDGQPYLALEYVEGQSITAYCAARSLDLRARVRLLLQVMDAVQYAHAHLVIHRDLKPGNVLVTEQGQAMLLDFGIAKLLQADEASAEATELTRVGGHALTLAYAAPEQVRGAAVSTATDVYALGVLLYELLAGQRPFGGAWHELEQAILTADPARPPALDADLATIVLKALKKAPAERYVTVNAMAEDLGRWLRGEPVLAQPDSFMYRLRKFIVRRRVPVAVGTAVALALLASSGAALHQADAARQQAAVARTEARTAQAVQAFLEDIFRANSGDQADPLKARQRSAKDLLDEGAARIDKALDDAPAAKLRVLKVLSDMYSDMGVVERQIDLRTAAVALASRAFPGPTAERASALAALATALSASARLAQARDVLRLAQSIAEQNPRLDPALRVEIAMAFVEDHMRRDDVAGLDAAAGLVALLRTQPPSGDLVGALLMRGRLQRVAGQAASSVQSLQESLAVAAQVPGGAAAGLSTLHMELSRSLAVTGDLSGAERHQRQALAQARQNAGPASFQAVLGLHALARLLADLGRPAEGLPLLDTMHQALAQWPHDLTRAQAAEGGATVEMTVWLRLGQPERALSVLAALDPLPMQELDDPRTRVELWCAEAGALIDLGRLPEAGAALDRAERLISRRDVAVSARRDVLLAKIRLLLNQQQVEPAQRVWRDVQALGTDTDPLASATEAELASAGAGPAAALALATRHLAALDAGPARLEQAFARFRLLMVSARALLALGRPAQALVPLDQALVLNTSIADGRFSPARLEALAQRAQAELALGRRADALRSVAEAQAILARHQQLGPQVTEPLRRAVALAG